MNQDTYVEWLVKRKEPAYAWPVRIILVLLCAANFLNALITGWGVILLAIVGVVTYFFFQSLSIEYEYLYIDGGVSIDRIYGKSRRKKVMECSRDELLIVAPINSPALKEHETNGMKVIDCSSGSRDTKKHALIYQKGALRNKVIFEPNDKMLQAIRYASPRKVVL